MADLRLSLLWRMISLWIEINNWIKSHVLLIDIWCWTIQPWVLFVFHPGVCCTRLLNLHIRGWAWRPQIAMRKGALHYEGIASCFQEVIFITCERGWVSEVMVLMKDALR